MTKQLMLLLIVDSKLLDSSESYRLANNRLTVEVEKLKADLSEQRVR